MRNLEGKNVVYAREDAEGGFYLIACSSYDTSLCLHHSQRKDVQIEFPRDVEPGIIRIFDINMDKEKKSAEEISQEYDDRSITVRMLSMKDDDFLLDKCTYYESQEKTDDVYAHILNNDMTYTQSDIEFKQYHLGTISAFSINWPYVACSGLRGDLIVLNFFDRTEIHRIEMCEDPEVNVLVHQTFITDTYDLFCVIQKDSTYELYMIDLDQSNFKERNVSCQDEWD